MPSYIPITDVETDPDAPLTSELAKKWRDNPEAIAEGALGATRVDGRALGGVFIGSAELSTSVWTTLTDLDRVGFLRLFHAAEMGTNTVLSVAYSNDNGSSWGSTQTVTGLSVGASGVFTGEIVVNLQTGSGHAIGSNTATTPKTVRTAFTHTVPSNCNAVRFLLAGGNAGVASFYIVGGLE